MQSQGYEAPKMPAEWEAHVALLHEMAGNYGGIGAPVRDTPLQVPAPWEHTTARVEPSPELPQHQEG